MIFLGKFFKCIFLVLITLILVIMLIFLQTFLAADNTLLSYEYFNNVYESNNISDKIETFFDNTIDDIENILSPDNDNGKETENDEDIEDILANSKAVVGKYIKSDWVSSEFTKLVKGTYAYLISSNEKLPVINVNPLKDMFFELSAEQITREAGEWEDSVQMMIKNVESVVSTNSDDGTINNTVMNEIMKIEIFREMGINRDTAARIVEKILNREEENTELRDIFDYIVRQIVLDRTDSYNMKDKLDLNLLPPALFGNSQNPISAMPDFIADIKIIIYLLIITLSILLALIIAAVAYSPRSTLAWVGSGLLFAGIILLTISSSGLYTKPFIEDHINEIINDVQTVDLVFLQNWMLSYIDGVYRKIIMFSAFFALGGLALIAGCFFVPGRNFKPLLKSDPVKGKVLIATVRVLLVTILVAAIPVSAARYGGKIQAHINDFSQLIEQSEDHEIDFDKAIDKVLNTAIFEKM